MDIIKLDATASTNTYLKNMVTNTVLKNFTVVTTDTQGEGRGQMGAKWHSEPYKNLLFSMYCRLDKFAIADSFFLSMAAATAIYKVLKIYKVPKLSVKWPNDIMSGTHKIGGLLLENTIKTNRVQHTIIGLGLNVNQKEFGAELPDASSLSNVLGFDLHKEALLDAILKSMRYEIENCLPETFSFLKNNYLACLYKYKTPAMFLDKFGVQFMGKIIDVTHEGALSVELPDDSIVFFNLKEIRFLH